MAENAIRIKTDPDPYEAFRLAQAYRVGDLIFVSGQAAIDLDGTIVGASAILTLRPSRPSRTWPRCWRPAAPASQRSSR